MKDAVWFVRPGPNEELRYSLRSAHAHVGVENVWIVGDPPPWYTGPLIPGNRHGTTQRNVYDNVRILSEHPDPPAEIAVWNDDFFALAPVEVEMAHKGSLADSIAGLRDGSWWKDSLTVTWDYLRSKGIEDPISYELHRPFPITRSAMASVLADAADVCPGNPPQWRTLYGNLNDAGGVRGRDGKLFRRTKKPTGVWLSTDEAHSWDRVRARIRRMFREPSPWEK